MAGDRRRGGHARADEVCATTLALSALEVAIAGRCAPLARPQDVGVHPQTHRAARSAPFEAGVREDLIEALLLGLEFDRDAARHHETTEPLGDAATADDLGRDPQVFDAGVRA